MGPLDERLTLAEFLRKFSDSASSHKGTHKSIRRARSHKDLSLVIVQITEWPEVATAIQSELSTSSGCQEIDANDRVLATAALRLRPASMMARQRRRLEALDNRQRAGNVQQLPHTWVARYSNAGSLGFPKMASNPGTRFSAYEKALLIDSFEAGWMPRAHSPA